MRRGAIVLCGGKSTRMGLPKASMPFGDEVMLARVVRLLDPLVEPIVVVAASGQDLPPLPENVQIVCDRRPDRGPLEGLAAGLAAIGNETEAIYATGCDVPLLVPGFVERLFGLLGDHEIVVPKDGKFFHPLAAVYRTSVLGRIERLLEEDRLRPVFLFEEADTREVSVEDLRDVDPELSTLKNLNRPEDYREALRMAGFEDPQDDSTISAS